MSARAAKKSRTQTGCITCRIRRVKCDETKPSCKRCSQSKRVCDGYLTSPPQSQSPASDSKPSKPLSRRALAVAIGRLNAPGPSARLLAPSPYLDDDVACFDFFRFRLTTGLGNADRASHARGFWNSTLLQASHAEPAAWHAVAALGALYRRWELVSSGAVDGVSQAQLLGLDDHHHIGGGSSAEDKNKSDPNTSLNSQSLKLADQASTCYTKALAIATSLQDPTSMLVLSLALAAIANLSGKWVDSDIHYQAGRRIMSQSLSERASSQMTEAQTHAADGVAKLGLLLMSFREMTVSESEIGTSPDDSKGLFPNAPKSLQDQCLWSLHRAKVELVDINRRILFQATLHTPVVQTSPLPANQEATTQAIIQDLTAWEFETTHLLGHTLNPTHHTTLDLLSLKLLHTIARLTLAANVMGPDEYSELGWDACLGYFERIVALATLIIRQEAKQNPLQLSVMSLDEPSINMALWLTAMRCRHPVVRRVALHLLQSVRRLEGVWMSTSAAAAAGRIIEIEEQGATQGQKHVNPARWLPHAKWAQVLEERIRQIEAEGSEWLGDDAPWTVPAAIWDVPGYVFVPLENRIVQVDVRVDYDANIGKSKGDLELIFVGLDEVGDFKRKTVSVYF